MRTSRIQCIQFTICNAKLLRNFREMPCSSPKISTIWRANLYTQHNIAYSIFIKTIPSIWAGKERKVFFVPLSAIYLKRRNYESISCFINVWNTQHMCIATRLGLLYGVCVAHKGYDFACDSTIQIQKQRHCPRRKHLAFDPSKKVSLLHLLHFTNMEQAFIVISPAALTSTP